jgi:hypothetical protein
MRPLAALCTIWEFGDLVWYALSGYALSGREGSNVFARWRVPVYESRAIITELCSLRCSGCSSGALYVQKITSAVNTSTVYDFENHSSDE